MNIPTLLNLKAFRKAVGREPRLKFWRERQLNIPLGIEGVYSAIKINFDYHTFVKTLNAIHRPTILHFDEAQLLGHSALTIEQKGVLRDVLDELHNQRKQAKNPIIFLMNGLGRTEEVLEEYGISRSADDSIIRLKALDKVSEKKIIYDYLVKEGKVSPKDPQLDHWIHQISEQTHGWPSHITSYGNTCITYLQEYGHSLNQEKLNTVLKLGTQKRYKYYDRRCRGVEPEDQKKIASFLFQKQNQEDFTRREFISYLKKCTSEKQSNSIFQTLVKDGCIHRMIGGSYELSIPSMKDWLLQTYLIKQVTTQTAKRDKTLKKEITPPIYSKKIKSSTEPNVSRGTSFS